MIPDPLIGERHPYYMSLWKEGTKLLMGVWTHKNPNRPFRTFADPDEAFKYTTTLNRIARLAKKVPQP